MPDARRRFLVALFALPLAAGTIVPIQAAGPAKPAEGEPVKVIAEAKFVPSGVAEVSRLQAKEGYAYLRP